MNDCLDFFTATRQSLSWKVEGTVDKNYTRKVLAVENLYSFFQVAQALENLGVVR